MSRLCPCGASIPSTLLVDGRRRNLCNRKHCLTCSPFGLHNTRALFRAPVQKGNADKFRRWQEKERRARKARLVAAFGGKCTQCGYNRCAAALEFHHRDPHGKCFSLNKGNLLRARDEVLTKAEKCTLLCANCHRELEDRLREPE